MSVEYFLMLLRTQLDFQFVFVLLDVSVGVLSYNAQEVWVLPNSLVLQGKAVLFAYFPSILAFVKGMEFQAEK